MMHTLSPASTPGHFFPPQKGTGLSHLLVQLFVPTPHVSLHDPHVHELHPPSTTQCTHITWIK